MQKRKYGLIPESETTLTPLTQVTHEDVYGTPDPDYSNETTWETVERYSDAFWASAEENMITSKLALAAWQNGEELIEDVKMTLSGKQKDSNFNPYDYIEGYENYALDFKDCDTIGDVVRTKKRIDLENKNIEAMSKVPVGVNFTNNLLTGFLDPVNLIPVGGQALKAKGVVKGALTAGAAAGGTNAIQEMLIKEMSYNYTDEEYAQNVLIGTVFGASIGAIGGAIGNIKDVAYRNQIKEQIDLIRKNTFNDEFQVKKGDFIENFNNKSVEEKLEIESTDSSVGAARVERTGTGVATEVDLDNKAVATIFKAERLWNPVAKLTTSVSESVRKVANSLFELPYYTNNIQDAFNVESLNKQVNTEISFLNKEFTDNYSKYYFDKDEVGIADDLKLLNPFGKVKQGKMTQKEFFSGVWDYLVHGKNADNKYIVDCANKFKVLANIQFDRINKLNDAGLINIRAVDKNWLPLMFDEDLVISDTNGFVRALSQKMKSFADELRQSGEFEFKNAELENIINNINKIEDDNRILAEEIKTLNSEQYKLNNKIKELTGQKKLISDEINQEFNDAKIRELQEKYDEINSEYKETKQQLSDIESKLESKRTLRDKQKEDIKREKRKQKDFEHDVEWQEKLLRLADEDYIQYATEIANEVRGVKDSINTLDGIRIDDRGSLLSRDFLKGDISMLEPFIVKDITQLLSPLRREMIDLNLIEKFGSVRLDEQIEDINRDYGIARSKLEERRVNEPENIDKINKLIKQLDDEQKKDIDFLQYSVDSMRGTEYAKRQYSDGVMKATELAKLYNIFTSLGRVTFSSIPDLMGSVLKTDLQSAIPALSILKKTFNADLAKSLGEVPELAHAITELHSNFREMSFSEMTDSNPFKSNTIKKTKAYADAYMHATLMSRWNALIKSVAGMSFMNKIHGIGDKLSKGIALSDGDIKWSKLYGFDEDELLEVYSSMNKYGDTTGSQKYANSGMWENKVLADKFKLGINKIMDSAVVTPGMEKARAFRDPILSTVLQFKTFIMSSTTRTLVPALQNARDYNTAVGLMFGLTLGMLSVAAKDGLSGKTDRAPGDYITEGFAASGIAGWTELPYTIVNAMTRGGFDKAMYAATGGFLGKESMTPIESERILLQQLGPSFGKIRNLFGFIGDVSSGKIKESSMYKLKSLIPFQNTIYLDWILRQVLLGWSDNK